MVNLKRVTPKKWNASSLVRTGKPLWVVLTGAGVSAESGLKTFRDANGLWEGHDVQEVASPEGFAQNPELVLEFYNQRRLQLGQVKPNAAHVAIAELEKNFDVLVVTQNVDDLHERGGSTQVLHLHGELTRVRSTQDENLIYDLGYETLQWGDRCEAGSQLRPHIVWFGESVPLYEMAAHFASQADALLVVGTSLQVYPAAGLIHEVPASAQKYLIDRKIPHPLPSGFTSFEMTATEGMDLLKKTIQESQLK
jgi:NAD-dependent deacetylase